MRVWVLVDGLCLFNSSCLTMFLNSKKNVTDWFGKRNQQLIVVKNRLCYCLAP